MRGPQEERPLLSQQNRKSRGGMSEGGEARDPRPATWSLKLLSMSLTIAGDAIGEISGFPDFGGG